MPCDILRELLSCILRGSGRVCVSIFVGVADYNSSAASRPSELKAGA